MRGFLAAAAGCSAAVALAFVPAQALARTTCPPDPAPGSTISGGLDVTGACHLNHASVSGGITVESTGGLELENSSVSGGITVEPGGELDSGHTLSSDTATFNPSTITGGVRWIHGLDMDLDNATITGGLNIQGPISTGSADSPTVCGSDISGGFTISDLIGSQSFEPPVFGDPVEPTQVGPHSDCPANTINTSVQINGTSGIEMEGNQISGSAQFSSSHLDFWGNTVGGSIQCTNGSTLTIVDGDATTNSAKGGDTC